MQRTDPAFFLELDASVVLEASILEEPIRGVQDVRTAIRVIIAQCGGRHRPYRHRLFPTGRHAGAGGTLCRRYFHH